MEPERAAVRTTAPSRRDVRLRLAFSLWLGLWLSVSIALVVDARLNLAPPILEQYTYSKGANCTHPNQVDPINMVFYGKYADPGNAIRAVRAATGWGRVRLNSPQQVRSGSRCLDEAGEVADASTVESRYHVRFFGLVRGGRFLTYADPHHEDLVWKCVYKKGIPGHAVDKGTLLELNSGNPNYHGSGFDRGQGRVMEALLNKDIPVATYQWGNTKSFRQCDGELASSAGYTTYVRLDRRF
jgi:hypothetical protein